MQINQCIEELLEVEEKHQKKGTALHLFFLIAAAAPYAHDEHRLYQHTKRVHFALDLLASAKTNRSKPSSLHGACFERPRAVEQTSYAQDCFGDHGGAA